MNRFIEFNYHNQTRPAVAECQHDEVLSLESVLEPFFASIDQLEFHLNRARSLPDFPTQRGLNKDQAAAIYLYTSDWGEQSLHRQFNKALQSGHAEDIKPWLGFLKLFSSAVENLPTVKETIYRRLPKDIENQLQENSEIVCWGFISCSTSIDIIQSIDNQNSILCSIEPLNAKNIIGYTPYPNDLEVLLLPGTRLRAKSVCCLQEICDVIDVDMASPQEDDNEQEADENLTPKVDDKSVAVTNISISQEGETKSIIIFADENYYKASYVNGKKQGHGKYYKTNHAIIEDQDADEKANGEGACVFKNGDCFIGTYNQGVRQGFGILCKKDGSIQIGNWDGDEFREEHSKHSSSGAVYRWPDKDGNEHDYNIYYDDKGNKFLGNILNGQAHGLGVRFWSDGSCYQGDFQNDKKHGYGIYQQAGRGNYVGRWENDEMHGHGRIIWKSKTEHEGIFMNGKRHGQGKLTFANKQIQEGTWGDDKYAGEI